MKKQFIDDELKMLHSDIEECKKKWEKIYECAAHGLTVRSPKYRAIEKAFLYI